ncbi:MAG: ATP-binding protein involved in chromosome partitioning [Granulosicoccus sp.]|jgi:ATP-binding protein involved in chromosome partitioning
MSLNKGKIEELLADKVSDGQIKNIQVFGKDVDIDLELSSPVLHVKKKAENAIIDSIQKAFGGDINVKIRTEVNVPEKPPRKGPEALNGVKNIVAVASGKGGVGKSTITANLAIALTKQGKKVGVLDADIYGPSMPIMFDIESEKPGVSREEGKRQQMIPVESYGVQVMSIGFFADPSQPIVWRGPMITKALNQMMGDVAWGELDILLVDLPPGTGDVHLSLVQAIGVTGAVVVSTPQQVALTDCRKGVAMFQLDSVNVPVLGIVENMAWFTPAELPNNRYYLFGKDGAKDLSDILGVKLLGQIPLVQSIREAGDAGRPAAMQNDTPVSDAFENLAKDVWDSVEQRNETLEPTEVVQITNR